MSTIIEPVFIEHGGKHTYAVVDIDQWRHIEAMLDEDIDIRVADRARAEPTLPLAQAERIWAGTQPLHVWREHQGLTQQALADRRQPGHCRWGAIAGIPKVQDRLIQQALVQVLSAVFDPTFSEHSHGFRPEQGPSGRREVGEMEAPSHSQLLLATLAQWQRCNALVRLGSIRERPVGAGGLLMELAAHDAVPEVVEK